MYPAIMDRNGNGTSDIKMANSAVVMTEAGRRRADNLRRAHASGKHIGKRLE
jgi:hypothetical protein|tara:strand:- start:426 stop:581 length:156 start_codon:yes stop_codon:yes gene_type:complete